MIDVLPGARGQLALVHDEPETLTGVVTPIDLLEAIAGKFPDDHEALGIPGNGSEIWTVAGSAHLHHLEQTLQTKGLVSDDDSYASLAGLLFHALGHVPEQGEEWVHDGPAFVIVEVNAQ